ncbi:hypothetical protein p1B102 (plasmid) [Aromatoleum aromaticum EbN1]|uniref:Uncharacterized protein n=1 Tax=Aromatoleum aromaticum (strain DSM 19018 / LMG 30748 / EbN1) TaxID=76114 RepID=Q5NX94_AROAE|nr:hypothetical protein p1B102 [Aromatoleum aromaticum EbN1]
MEIRRRKIDCSCGVLCCYAQLPFTFMNGVNQRLPLGDILGHVISDVKSLGRILSWWIGMHVVPMQKKQAPVRKRPVRSCIGSLFSITPCVLHGHCMRKKGALCFLPSSERKDFSSACSVWLRRRRRSDDHRYAQFATGSCEYALDCLQSGGVELLSILDVTLPMPRNRESSCFHKSADVSQPCTSTLTAS